TLQPEQRFDSAAHFAGSLVRESDGEDAVRRGTLDLYEPGDAMREHARLAAARAGQHERRRERRGNRGALRLVEAVENAGNVHSRIVARKPHGSRVGSRAEGLPRFALRRLPGILCDEWTWQVARPISAAAEIACLG